MQYYPEQAMFMSVLGLGLALRTANSGLGLDNKGLDLDNHSLDFGVSSP